MHVSPQYRKTIMSFIRIKHALRKTEIGAEFNVMGYIAHHGLETLATPSQIAHQFHMTTPMVAKVIRTLQRKKYITVKTDPKDHRKSLLQLTKAGERNLRQKMGAVHKWYLSIFDKLGKKDSQEFVRLLEKVSDIAIANIKGIKNV